MNRLSTHAQAEGVRLSFGRPVKGPETQEGVAAARTQIGVRRAAGRFFQAAGLGALVLAGCTDKATDTATDTSLSAIEACLEKAEAEGELDFTDCDRDGVTPEYGDCDDSNANIHPEAQEVCDGIDNDCDNLTDDDDDGVSGTSTWYADSDGDGYGNEGSTTQACDEPANYVDNADDCDDTDELVHPDADEVCDDIDNDCDGATDDEDDDVEESSTSTFYEDGDGDGYGVEDQTTQACDLPEGYSASAADCNDANADIYPGAPEYCDGEDNDCDKDGEVDENAVDAVTYYEDGDEDEYGLDSSSITTCEQPDGFVEQSGDCNDNDEDINPGATEVCDEEDNDCDGDVDEDDAEGIATWYQDGDSDGYGDELSFVEKCGQPTGYVLNNTDCDDANSAAYPGAEEVCDGADNDCDGDTDSDATDKTTWYVDADSDSYGDSSDTEEDCLRPTGYVADGSDCDDADSSINPGATEICDDIDNDCDGDADSDATDKTTWYADGDSDSYGDSSDTTDDCDQPSGYVADGGDCDDTDSDVNPGATEYCDNEDNDCDGDVDEGAADLQTFYADADSDGYGDASTSTEECDQPSGYVTNNQDCNDGEAAAYTGADEICDGVDNDCDGDVDVDAIDAFVWYKDGDSDSYGSADDTTEDCNQPSGYVADSTDCDDSDSSINPTAYEYCDGEDNDCDGDTDESDAVDMSTWYADADADGYGDATITTEACDQPDDYASNDDDCDDSSPSTYPGADEYCNEIDDDCDGATDESNSVDAETWYHDGDADGYGDESDTNTQCDQPSDYVANSNDCDDTDSDVNPGADEECDAIDNDCDGDTDEGDAIDASTWYADSDSDTYGNADDTTEACDQPSGYVTDAQDCNDADASVNPDADEYCDNVDNDCDGDTDESSALDVSTWYADSDGDSYGNAADITEACDQPDDYVTDSSDCDDADASAYPGADEYCDDVDNDCNGITDESSAVDAVTYYHDGDADGYGDADDSATSCSELNNYVTDSSDCDDADADIHPGADEECDSIDNDCDEEVDEDAVDGDTWYADSDSDGYGNADDSTIACDQPSGYVDNTEDCDDSTDEVNPAASEGDTCDNIDNDCDGGVEVVTIGSTDYECVLVRAEASVNYGNQGTQTDSDGTSFEFLGDDLSGDEACTDYDGGFSAGTFSQWESTIGAFCTDEELVGLDCDYGGYDVLGASLTGSMWVDGYEISDSSDVYTYDETPDGDTYGSGTNPMIRGYFMCLQEQ